MCLCWNMCVQIPCSFPCLCVVSEPSEAVVFANKSTHNQVEQRHNHTLEHTERSKLFDYTFCSPATEFEFQYVLPPHACWNGRTHPLSIRIILKGCHSCVTVNFQLFSRLVRLFSDFFFWDEDEENIVVLTLEQVSVLFEKIYFMWHGTIKNFPIWPIY